MQRYQMHSVVKYTTKFSRFSCHVVITQQSPFFCFEDPTAGPSANEQTSWCLDENTLHDNVKKTLVKFCVPAPIVYR